MFLFHVNFPHSLNAPLPDSVAEEVRIASTKPVYAGSDLNTVEFILAIAIVSTQLAKASIRLLSLPRLFFFLRFVPSFTV